MTADQLELLPTERRLVVRVRLKPIGVGVQVKLELVSVAGDADCLPVDGMKLDRVWRGIEGSYGKVTELADAVATLRARLFKIGAQLEVLGL